MSDLATEGRSNATRHVGRQANGRATLDRFRPANLAGLKMADFAIGSYENGAGLLIYYRCA